MRKVERVAAAFLLAAVWCITAYIALADTGPAGEDQDSHILAALARPTSTQPSGQDQARFLLFSTTDLWRQGGFAHG
jgi:hypothetical protein